MRDLHIIVHNKIATYLSRGGNIVCRNKDYQIVFSFDSEWDAYAAKVARFIWNNGYRDIPFSGNTVAVPEITNAKQLKVGVYAGDLHTTTPAVIDCEGSILCEHGLNEVPEPTPDVYQQILELLKGEDTFATPEMYGAAGDGVADDTAAIQAAVDSGKPVVIPEGVYLTTAPIIIGQGVQLHCYGEIKYSGADYAVILDNAIRSDVHFTTITASNGGGLKLHSHDSKMCAYNNVSVIQIIAKDTGICNIAEYGNQYNEIRFTQIKADICIDIQCSASGWNNETNWHGGHLGGNGKHATYAIKAVNSNGGDMNIHRFYNVGFEGVVDGCILENVQFFVFNYPRTSENIDNKAFVLKPNVRGCVFNLSYFPLKWLDFSEHKTASGGYGANANQFQGAFRTDAGEIYNFTSFEIWDGRMQNCNQGLIGYYNAIPAPSDTTMGADTHFLTLDPINAPAYFPQQLVVHNRSVMLDARYYHSKNIKTLYVKFNGDNTSPAFLSDSNGNEILKAADYPYKKVKLTAVDVALDGFAPNGWIVEVLS